jgi:hypothetical protein
MFGGLSATAAAVSTSNCHRFGFFRRQIMLTQSDFSPNLMSDAFLFVSLEDTGIVSPLAWCEELLAAPAREEDEEEDEDDPEEEEDDLDEEEDEEDEDDYEEDEDEDEDEDDDVVIEDDEDEDDESHDDDEEDEIEDDDEPDALKKLMVSSTRPPSQRSRVARRR